MLKFGQTTKQVGDSAEQAAEHFLQQQGLTTLKKNFRCKLGEVDLIMRHGSCLVFVEVRYRKQNYFGSGSETVTASKQQKLIRTAQYFLQKHDKNNIHPCRFDVVSISGDLNQPDIDWLENAFGM
ncbi:MAG: YraN family protein [Candidatus Pelagadaptatus aseana]|uniref:YraN family protein n=1 Tax=Candidatus Pelagadaptatus aseana TaxID=3120508 RepID=UPI0039B3254C